MRPLGPQHRNRMLLGSTPSHTCWSVPGCRLGLTFDLLALGRHWADRPGLGTLDVGDLNTHEDSRMSLELRVLATGCPSPPLPASRREHRASHRASSPARSDVPPRAP